jgi:drug/metabolite transporter (DMT)-like permease
MKHKHVAEKYLFAGIIVSMFLWGLSWPSAKVLTRYCTVINFTVYRYIVVIATMLLILPFLRVSLSVKKRGIPMFITSGVLLAIYSYFLFVSLKKGTPGAGGVLVTTLNPIIAYSIGILLKRELPSRNEGMGLFIGLIAGCVLLKVWDHPTEILRSGNLYFLLSAFVWAVMSKFTAKGGTYGSSMGFTLWQYVITLLCLLPLTDFGEMQRAIHITDSLFWVNLFFGSAIVTAMATTIYFYSTTKLGAEKASSFLFLVPFAAAISSWLLLGEQIKLHTAIGGAIGIVAVYIMNRKPKARLQGG